MANPEHLEILKQGVEVWNKWRVKDGKRFLDLTRADFSRADFSGADFSGVDFSDARFHYADLSAAIFPLARLNFADLHSADLSSAKLSYADLLFTNLRRTIFNDADFTNVKLAGVTFADNDLSQVKGLEAVIHISPSTVGIDTIYTSRGNIPEVFLRGCGVPESLIVQMHALVTSTESIQFYSCFISYSAKNQLFADRLYADLQNKGVRCWLASKDLKIGAKTRIAIDESIRFHDKLLLILTKHSVASDWVEQEVETALARERKEKRTVLFPIRLDDEVMKIDTGWTALIKNSRNIGDFRKWRNQESYNKAFDRLLRDLKAEGRQAAEA